MTDEKQVTAIKKCGNRRLYKVGARAYVTREDLAGMVKRGEDFVVFDAKSGEDVTRSVLTQIVFEEEGKHGQSLLPIAFLRALIRFCGDSMQMLVPTYLEFSLDQLTSELRDFRAKVAASGFDSREIAPSFGFLREMARKNMALFIQAFAMPSPLLAPLAGPAETPPEAEPDPTTKSDMGGV